MTTVAVLGTGRMGSAMAQRLGEAGHDVRVWNRSPEAADKAAQAAHGSVAASAPEAAAGAELVMSVFATGEVTSSVLGDPEFLSAVSPSTPVCDMATSGLDTALALASTYANHDRLFVDSPVSGSVPSVLSGSLLVMASGPEDAVNAASMTMSAFAKRVAYLGAAGNGQSMKLAVNLVVHALNSAVAEGLALAGAAGISREDAYDVLLDSSVAAPYVGYKQAAFLGTDGPVAMSVDLVAKDLGLIGQRSRDLGLTLSTLDAVSEEIAAARAAGFGGADMADVVRFLSGEEAPQRP